MSDEAIPDRTRLPIDVLDRIDRACDRLEAAWARGERPRVEDAIGEIAAPFRRALLRDLLAAEITARRRLGESPEPREYRGRFAGDDSTIDSAFGEVREAGPGRPDFDETVDRAPTDPHFSVRRPTLAEGPGTTIGPYKLLQQIGEGGMGTVFMAEQEKPVRRKVALKVIKPGMDTGQVIARFEAERQALAIMEHPNIARVLDVGATETGRPFFVMELVRGVPITEYCDRNHLAPKERLELFIPVCQAIQHAHQKGIIHRDIKPSNVLVALHDGVPVPKVIDFGVAKAIDQGLTERTLFTEFGAIIGTLEYMSPEQAEMGALDIDTRSDIYSLGVLLYELLTGSTPLERAKLRKAAYSEILKRIREEEPPKPSTRLSESNDALPSISAQRKMEPARLTRLVRGDLDWIVMKSLEKDRARRYETATGFARDIQRYLDGDAVEACPPRASYKLRKFALKHRAALATAGAFAMLLMAATAISVGLALWADRERIRALGAEADARAQKSRAEDREKLAIDAVKKFRDAVVNEDVLKNSPALKDLRKRLLNEPLAFFRALRDRLQDDHDTRPESLVRLADACFSLGSLTDQIGDKQDALVAYHEALTIRQRLVDANPGVTVYRRDLANSHNDIGLLQWETGNQDEALGSYRRAIVIYEKLADDDPAVGDFQHYLASTHHNIGLLQSENGKLIEALESYKQGLKIRQKLADANPGVAAFRDRMAGDHNEIGMLLARMGEPVKAETEYRMARAIWQEISEDNPDSTDFRNRLASSLGNLGNLLSDTGRPEKAEAEYRHAMRIQQRLVLENPTISSFRNRLADIHNNSGMLLLRKGELAEAEAEYRHALSIYQKLADDNPGVAIFRSNLVGGLAGIGAIQRRERHNSEAVVSFRRAIAVLERLPTLTTSDIYNLACLHALLSGVAAESDSGLTVAEARAEADRAMDTLRRAVAAGFRNLALMRRDNDLDPLRAREDFRLLMMDLAMPAQPFARGSARP